MSSNLKVNTILPSTGSNIGIGTNGGELNVDGGCKVQVGTALTLGHSVGLQYATQNLHSAGFEVNQINASGIITATSFSGSGANLTGITGTTINNNADNRIITGSGTANTLEAESGLTYSGNILDVTNAVKLPDDGTVHFGASDTAYVRGKDSTDGYLKLGSAGLERVRVNSTGNVSIGGIDPVATASAYDKASLHIHQTNSGSNKGSQVHLTTAHTGSAAGDGSQISAYATSLYINNQENGDTYFFNNGSPTATIKANGSFGIGTQAPTDKLHVNGTTNLGGNTYLTNAYVSGNIYIGGSGSANALDDYEEGSFTPTTSGISATHNPNGIYTKIGDMVFISIVFTRSGSANFTFSGGDSGVVITNLPFTCGNKAGVGQIIFPRLAYTGSSDGQGATVLVEPGQAKIYVSNAGFSSPRANLSVFYSIN